MLAPHVRRFAFAVVGLLALGLCYAAFATATGLLIPCPFRAVTGLLCPGCGVSHLCLALLRLDFAAAWAANPGLFCALPVLAVLLGGEARRYLTGAAAFRWEEPLAWGLAVWLVLWGIVRNL